MRERQVIQHTVENIWRFKTSSVPPLQADNLFGQPMMAMFTPETPSGVGHDTLHHIAPYICRICSQA